MTRIPNLLPTAILLALVGCCTAPPPARAPDHVRLAADLADKTVELLELPDPEGDMEKCEAGDVQCIIAAAMEGTEPHVYCSGEWVSAGQILTANHCMEDAKLGAEKLYAVQDDLVMVKGEATLGHHVAHLAARDALHDLALLTVVGIPPAHTIAVLAQEVVRPGQDAYAMGAPLGMGWSYSAGQVAQVRWIEIDDQPLWYIQATTPISPGSSGGGLYDEAGLLIGVCKANAPRGENLNLFVHRDDVRAFLQGAKVIP